MTYREEVMTMAQEARLGQLLPATATQPAQWYGNPVAALEKFAAFVLAKERERVSKEAKQRKQEVKS